MSIIVRSNDPTADAQVNAPTEKAGVAQDATTSAPEAKASEHKETEASETPDEAGEGKKETDSGRDDAEAEDASESDGSEDVEKDGEKEEKPQGKKKGGFQRKIDKLTAARAAAQQEAEYWRRRALEGAGDKSPESKVETAKPAAPEGKPKADDFETHAEYVEALTDWKVEQAEKTRTAREQNSRLEAEQKTKAQSYQERARAFAVKQADFAEVLSEVDGIPISPALQNIILESENGPELAYELAKLPDEFERICKLGPMAAAREIGKLEARLKTSAPEKKSEPQKITKAPKPLDPVGTGGKGATPKSLSDPNLSQAEYERLRREQTKRRQA